MTNEEMKKKIVKVLKETINWTTDYSIPIGIVYKSDLSFAAIKSTDIESTGRAEILGRGDTYE